MPNFPYWNDTITIVNKLSAKDSITKRDTYKKTVLHKCFYKQITSRSVTGTTVNLGSSAVCRIPKNVNFRPYHEWKEDISQGFTLSVGDYIFLGELKEDATADNIISLYNEYKPNAMVVKAAANNADFMGFGEHYKAEGV